MTEPWVAAFGEGLMASDVKSEKRQGDAGRRSEFPSKRYNDVWALTKEQPHEGALTMFAAKLVALSGVVMMTTAISQSHAQTSPQSPFVGSWEEIVNINPTSPYRIQTRGLITFNSDGTATDSTATDLYYTFTSTPGHGVWQTRGGNTAIARVEKLLYDTSNSPNLTSEIIQATVTMPNVNSFVATGTLTFLSNTQVIMTLPFTSTGSRITLP